MSKISLSGDSSGTGTFTIASPNSNSNYTLNLPTATGTINTSGAVNEVPAGSASAPSIYPTGDTNTGIFFPAADTIAFTEGGTEAMRIDSSGNLGLGVTPSAWSGYGSPVAQLPNNGTIVSSNTNAYFGANWYYASSAVKYNTTAAASYYAQGAGQHIWYNAPSGTAGNTVTFTQAMTLDASGNLLVGRTSLVTPSGLSAASIQSSIGFSAYNGTNAAQYVVDRINFNSSNFYVINASSTGVVLPSGNTSWSAQSDERLKDVIEPIENAAEKVSSLRAVIGKYKKDEAGKRRAFLMAQDVQAVLPEAVTEDADGYLLLGYSETIPLLVAAIQEQQALITSLTSRIAALEAKE